MINLSKFQWIVIGVGLLIVIVALDILIGTTVTPRLIATPTPTMSTNILFVKPEANGDCRENWFHACDLQTALGKAHPGEEIWVAEGVYTPTLTAPTNPRSATFQLNRGVAIYGGFAGKETSRDDRKWDINITVLSGDIDGNDITAKGVITDIANIKGENSYHVVTSNGVTTTAVLNGFTITGGQANGEESKEPCGPKCGGGVYNDGGSPKLANVAFSGNFAALAGGGMWNYNNSTPSLTNVSFMGNTANKDGGGMHNTSSSPSLTNVTFSGNRVDDAKGGGMYNTSSSPILTRTKFISNTAYFGGGMFNDNNSGPTLLNVIFRSGVAQSNGGGMYNMNSNPTLVNITFAGNRAYDQPDSGGMRNTNSNPTLTNCILWDNSQPQQSIHNDNSKPTISHSLVQGGYPGTGNLDADPRFVNLDEGDLHLQRGSPVIDNGLNSAVEDAGVTTDLDGKSRFCGKSVDMGAYEFQTENCPQE